MSFLWGITAMNYYIIYYFMKYVPGNLYVNMSVSTISELIAYIVSGIIYTYLGEKKSFFISFSLAATGGALIAFFADKSSWIAVFVFLAKFGISFSYNLVYIVTPYLFPTERSSTAFGICNAVAMFSAIFSPIAAEMDGSLPMLIYCFSSAGAIFVVLFLNLSQKKA